jgi:predicted ATPase/class 3 adenylate cyclase
MAQLPTGTVTFLFTDIEGSTKLLQRLGPEYARVLGEHQALLRAAFAAHDGAEVDTQGDAFFVAFPSAPQAVAAAAEATHALASHSWPEGATLRVRMGLHTGTPQLVGDHYVGLDVHRAARIAAAGHGGQALLSQTTGELVEQTLPAGITLRRLGLYRLKDLQQPELLFQLVVAGLPVDFPPLKTLDLRPHNLPIQPTPLLDRVEQLPALTALLRRADVRLVTLTGPGGIGKTRLAAQVAAELVEDFADGVWFVRLSRLVDPALVLPTIVQTLGLTQTGSQSLADLLQAYVADKRLLLVLDNVEQVAGVAPELAALLGSSPGLRLLVTSRVSLHLRGEHEYPLGPLPLPPDLYRLPAPERLSQYLSQYAAVALFIERAQATRPDFAVTSANAPAIAAICARLDGLPLAIELAAARVRVLPPEALLARLSTQLTLLAGGPRDVDERQQTMRAAIAWSEDLLAPAERVLFRRLAVFVGGCTLEAAEAVCAAPEGGAPLSLDLLDGLTTLVDHSLVQQREEGGEPRFGMLQVIREYALERLEASGEAETLRRAHATALVALVERSRDKRTGAEAAAWLERLEREHDNLRAALGWLRDHGEAELGLHLAGILGRFWKVRGHFREGRTWVQDMLALDTRSAANAVDAADAATASPRQAETRARALLTGGVLAMEAGEYTTGETWTEQARAWALAANNLAMVRQALTNLGIIARHNGDLAGAATRYRESLALTRELGDQRGTANVLTNLGYVASLQGDLAGAAALYTDSLALARERDDRDQMALCLNNLGVTARKRGDVAQAEALLREALALYWEQGNPSRCAMVLESLAETSAVVGQGKRAARLLGAAAALREPIGALLSLPQQAKLAQEMDTARAALGEATWAAAFTAGQALTLEEVIAEALGEVVKDD